jgi:FKBP-type peptidyl-prolyl cis-trans isomerase SlyD
MKITPTSFVTLDYLMRTADQDPLPPNAQGEEISLCLGMGLLPPSLEEAMVGMGINEQKTVRLTPEQSFGEVDESLITEVPRKDFDPVAAPKPGDVYETMDEQGHPVYFMVKELKDDTVVIDFNHPLAGKEVIFTITVKAVREATPEDLAGFSTCSCGRSTPHEH